MSFQPFGRMVAASFQSIAAGVPFVVAVSGDKLFERYLSAFPEGTNPIFKKRTEHDCACCKSFIRHAGNVVSVNADGSVRTVWDEAAEDTSLYPYNVVATALRDLVRDAHIADIFRTTQNEYKWGSEKTISQDPETGRAVPWVHFFTGDVPKTLRAGKEGPDTIRGAYRTLVDAFERSLKELKPSAVETCLTVIDGIYRGAEHRSAVEHFQTAQQQYLVTAEVRRNAFVWSKLPRRIDNPMNKDADLLPVFRNTSIGTLVEDLSDGKDIDTAVASFEAKVAPANYKRTTALITPGMVKQAMTTIAELGLEPALERRFARIEDVSVNDVLWVDGGVKPLMKGGIGDVLMKHATAKVDTSADEKRAVKISMDRFVKEILPLTTGMDLMFKGRHSGNLMSLTAPVHPEPKQLFLWDNDFAFSYIGNVADSIKERVKAAGGRIDAPLRCSLAWSNGDDLDLHVFEPRSRVGVGNEICYTTYRKDRGTGFSPLGGQLDVDMNAGGVVNQTNPVENIYWKSVHDGTYVVRVHNYTKRSEANVGFAIEVECNGQIFNFAYNKAVRNNATIDVVEMTIKGGSPSFKVLDDGISSSSISQEKWGVQTETYVPVDAVTYSPNYWGKNAVGNKHLFFFLHGVKSDEAVRGIHNEFLNSRLLPHRKVFEVIGEKTKCPPVDNQLSGLGFSSTKPDSVLVRVTQGSKKIVYEVQFGAGGA